MRSCELCGGAARMYCESDQASLCWDCDRKVHGANFLVAKHTRSLLCHACQSPTGWKASGLNLGPAYSVCESCVRDKDHVKDEERTGESESYGEDEIDTDFDDDEETDFDEEEHVEDTDNQVVPWSADSSPTPPVVVSSDSSDGEEEVVSGLVGGGERFRLKRMRENLSVYTEDDGGSAASSSGDGDAEFRVLKQRK